jgi:hypothetical protein
MISLSVFIRIHLNTYKRTIFRFCGIFPSLKKRGIAISLCAKEDDDAHYFWVKTVTSEVRIEPYKQLKLCQRRKG